MSATAVPNRHLEMVRLVRFRLVSDKFLYMIGKRIEFLIDMMERRDSTLRGYGEFYLFMTYFGLFLIPDINTRLEKTRVTSRGSRIASNREYPLQIPLKIPPTIPLKIPSRSETLIGPTLTPTNPSCLTPAAVSLVGC